MRSKIHNKIIILSLLLFTFTFINSYSQAEGDRILAIVGNDIILESDFQYQVQLYAQQNQLTQINPLLAQQIFQQMLTDKIVLAKAIQDSIEVTDDEVNRELDFRITSLIEQFGSIQRIEELYGMSLGKIKITLREELAKKLMTDKLKRKKFAGGIKVSDKEVREFFRTYQDSLPPASEEFELSHIFLIRKITDTEKKYAEDKANLILDSIKNGVDFSELAKRNSDDTQSAIEGGDLGFATKGSFVKPFEDALLSLKEGEVSEIVETEFGYHIIKLTEKIGDKLRSSHILIAYPRFESSDLETISFLNDLKTKIDNNEITFEDAAKQYSQDTISNKDGGYIGFVPVERLDSAVLEEIDVLDIGGITKPVRIGTDLNYGYEILKVISNNPEHKLTFENDYDVIKSFTLFYKENEEMEKWINELRETIYVDVKF
ncbi:MAG: peptidylprolyl isomerase [Ignavibacteria bacterium]|nr:peptidylprolyl isomerase [Ignavibacteria bacterium]